MREILIADAVPARAQAKRWTSEPCRSCTGRCGCVSGSLAEVAGAAVTVITAGAAQRPGEPRPALVRRNVEALRGIVGVVVRANPDGLLLVATNPVDALTWAALQMSGLPPARVIGSGTVLDSARLRAELAAHYGVDARNVHAYVLGEHGDSEFVAWSTATLGNMGLVAYCAATGMTCTEADLQRIGARVRRAAYEIIQRKGATNFAIASALTRIVEAIVRDESSVLTVSTRVQGEYGLRDVCLSLPAIVGRAGVQRILPVPLAEAELQALRRSADAIRGAMGNAG